MGNDWNSFMQRKSVQVALYGICTIFCLAYAVDGIRELISPDSSAALIESIGTTAFYALTITRSVILLITTVAFARITYKTYAQGK